MSVNNTVTIFGHTFEHLSIIRTLGNPAYGYIVQTDDGYYIHTEELGENIYKTVTGIYSTDNLDAIVIIPESELPEGAEIWGDTNEPDHEIM